MKTMETVNTQEACHVMEEGEVLHADKSDYPLYHAVLYGDRVLTTKLSKRLSCAIKHLPLRLLFTYEHDTLKAIEQGITIDPSLVLEGKLFLEGLVSAEEISEAFERLLLPKEKTNA